MQKNVALIDHKKDTCSQYKNGNMRTCASDTAKAPRVLIWGSQIHFSEWASLQIRNLGIVRLDCNYICSPYLTAEETEAQELQ